ncbi:MAG: polysaccharide deacetylase family protein [Firmicutes bacterium]|nr:polysaccharide deacetylase family protein [Bacillota bacterium]
MKILIIKRTIILIALLSIVFGLGYWTGMISKDDLPTMGLLAREMPIFYVKKKAPEVCLTFDISWGEKTWPLVLKVLEEHQVPASFFISGPWAVRHPEAVKEIYHKGHEIASHGDRHLNLSQYPKAVVKENISKAHQDLSAIVEKVAPFFRPPNGDYDDLVIDTARELGFETVIWAVDSLDWKNPGPEYMIERVLKRVFPGAIILCHASDSSKQIHLALPGIISGLRSKGYRLVTLSELAQGGSFARNDPR